MNNILNMSKDLKSNNVYIQNQIIMKEDTLFGVTNNNNEISNMVTTSDIINSTIATKPFVEGNLIIPSISPETILEMGGVHNIVGKDGQMMLNSSPADNNLYIYKNGWKKIGLTDA